PSEVGTAELRPRQVHPAEMHRFTLLGRPPIPALHPSAAAAHLGQHLLAQLPPLGRPGSSPGGEIASGRERDATSLTPGRQGELAEFPPLHGALCALSRDRIDLEDTIRVAPSQVEHRATDTSHGALVVALTATRFRLDMLPGA